MNDEPGSECDLLARLESLTNRSMGVSYIDFKRLLSEGNASIPVSQLNQVHTFACDQLGFWMAEWSFSPAHSPNTVAETEKEVWQILCQDIFNTLVENYPDIRDLPEQRQKLIVLQHLIRRAIEYNKTKPFRKLTAIVLAKVSFVFNKIGFHSIATKLYTWSIYPKGTVARP